MTDESDQGHNHDKTWTKVEKKFRGKHASQYFDPCQEFADRSLQCMKRNPNDREMCHDYFQAYRDCKHNWLTQKKASLTPKD